jgi:hypothetical protein
VTATDVIGRSPEEGRNVPDVPVLGVGRLMARRRAKIEPDAIAYVALALWALVTLVALFVISAVFEGWPLIARISAAGAIGLVVSPCEARVRVV